MKAFFKQIPVIFYFTLACVVSWLSLLPIIGIDGFLGKTIPSDNQMPLLFIAMCAGPLISCMLSIYLIDGKDGFKELTTKLVKWKINFRFYLIALFTAPALTMVAYLILSLFSPEFTPAIFSSEGKLMIIIGGIVGALVAGFFEELGWTGFAIPKLRLKYNIINTGLIVGIVWGIWHFPLFMIKDPTGVIPLIILLMVRLITHLPAFRILMTWVYDRTGSLLIIMLMHMSLTGSALIFQPNIESGVDIIISNLTYTILLYAAVFIINNFTKGQITGRISKDEIHKIHTKTMNYEND